MDNLSYTFRNVDFSGLAGSGGSSGSAGKGDVFKLECEIERLLMITEALWTFIKEKHGYCDEDLIKMIARIDAKDGKLDGRVAPEEGDVKACSNCGRAVGKNKASCMFCGTPVVRQPFER